MFRYLFIPFLGFVFYCSDRSFNNACDINSESYLESTIIFNLLSEGKNNCSTGTIAFFPTVIALSSKRGVVSEGGGSLQFGSPVPFSVSLKEKPEAQVDIELIVSNPDYGHVNPTTLSFSSNNWSTPQEIQITGVNDSLINGTRDFRVVLIPKSTDSKLDLNPAEIQMQVLDNEKKIFLSANPYRGGDFGGVSGADAICQSESKCPLGSSCKAMILNGTTRIASLTANVGDGQVDWVLKPNAYYYLADGTTLISNTGSTSLLQVPLVNVIGAVTFGAWFGSATGWVYGPNHCNGWTDNTAFYTGNALRTQNSDATFFGGNFSCSNQSNLLCVEQ
ncbi:DUF1554 domain-containing protein [Leptospira congkakensis]|uniref:DUF1554 domain-containing protein n=1 Tax=Leptospira congkakensis TaxID=2484932 RepID=A0A4Z1AB64_9LEPT|nr:DUF1554 domain-containing protein [Leptospira congkakensis]TGL87513.1 DUF1554 domain-containing protein [Leptospira congkakensis]TGL89872.1 DUF1554 domain-containing protein [Leptospira congkakensis]TGL95662.1 DUF1554 domain-containing protein [Leptospira congkakensis]